MSDGQLSSVVTVLHALLFLKTIRQLFFGLCDICSKNKLVDYFKITDLMLKASIVHLRHDIVPFGRQFVGCVEGFYIVFILFTYL
jgi:hypothetical protein